MTKEIRLSAIIGSGPADLSSGLWAHPRNRAREYNSLDYWVELARVLERGKFDALLVADNTDAHEITGSTSDSATHTGVQLPKHDPLMAVSAMAHVTKHLGFGITASTSDEIPAVLARRFSSLDHLTKGRIGWNIVASDADNGAKAIGSDSVNSHDTWYDRADEFLEVTYKLWEGSWQDGAVIRDPVSGVFADPARVRRVRHQGEYFRLDTIHLTEPSPQRTPFLFQVEPAKQGRDLAAQHAEAVLLNGSNRATVGLLVRDVRERAMRLGRNPRDIVFFARAAVIVGRTRDEVQSKLDEYRSYVDIDDTPAQSSGRTGIEVAQFELDAPIESFASDNPADVWTRWEAVERNGIGGGCPVLVGTPTDVADALQSWAEATDIDGFCLGSAVTFETYTDFVDLVVPELQRRGAYKMEYAAGTLRAKIQGQDALKKSHPGAAFRNLAD